LLGTPTGDAAGAGTTLTIGSIQALSGPGASFGKQNVKGLDLAAADIKAAGGPTFKFETRDQKSGDTQAGAAATRELGLLGVPVVMGSYSAVLGSMLPGIKQYKMFTFDPGGGVSPAQQGQPYFYGTRAAPNTEPTAGLLKYIHETIPDAKKIMFVTWDVGDVINKAAKAGYDKSVADNGLTSVGYEKVKIGSTDFSDIIAKIKAAKPDVFYSQIYSPDIAYFMKQFANSGLKIPVVGSDYIDDLPKIGGASLAGYKFGFDYFLPQDPQNDWAKMFVPEYQAKYGALPDVYAANAYESLFAVWQLVRDAIKAGDDIKKGESYVSALEANGTFPSLYGAGDGKTGQLVVDPKTHAVSKRAMGVYQSPTTPGDPPKLLATFDIGGADFKLVQ
jgi:branched-chain amino acid transport system substrate-binding protein